MENAARRLHAVQRALAPEDTNANRKRVLVLPDDAKVDVLFPLDSPTSNAPVTHEEHQFTKITIDGIEICQYRLLPRSLSLVVSAIGTPYEDTADHVPKYPLIELLPPSTVTNGISIPDLWATIYTFHTIYHTQETIPVILSPSIPNYALCTAYLLESGLARKRHAVSISAVAAEPELFLLRATFWQGGGILGYHSRGWLRGEAAKHGPFPYAQSFTRSALVIASHPHRPPKPRQGECVYRKYWPSMGKCLEFTYFDSEESEGEAHIGRHLEAFHRWHNDPRVNKGWGEKGTIEYHREYARKVMDDPSILPLMMSWDGELMGYCEIVWLKENHIAPYIPEGARDYDRGLHILVGEDKYRGIAKSKPWIGGITHFCFLSDSRTDRVIGEPKAENEAVIKLSLEIGMHLQTIFDFPYKRSVMTWNPREKFFKYDHIAW